MATISQKKVKLLLNHGLNGESTTIQGKALEDLACYLFLKIPGVQIAQRNILNAFATEEIDIAFWNNSAPRGIPFLPTVILAECKNWSHAVGSQEISYFANRLQNRGCEYGILFATNGITGNAADLTRAHFEISAALSKGRRILVITKADIQILKTSDQLILLLKKKMCDLVVSGTTISR